MKTRFGKAFLKQVLERTIARTAPRVLPTSRLNGKVLILSYHNIVPVGEEAVGDRSLHLPLTDFVAQLDHLEAEFRVVGLAEGIAGEGRERREPGVVITIDDAYLGAVRHGVPELARRGLPATIFVAPALLVGRQFWWDRLSTPDGTTLSPAARQHALWTLQGRGQAVEPWASKQGYSIVALPPTYRCATEPELRDALAYSGLSIGSHSWSHSNLAALAPEELRAELGRSLEWLEGLGSRAIKYLAYPFGLSSLAVRQMASSLGYAGALELSGGWFRLDGADTFRYPRLNVPAGVSREGFALRVAGLLRQ